MKEQSSAFLEKARSFLTKAQDLLDAHHLADQAAGAAYLAGLHGVEALIFEHADNIIRRHCGVQRELGRLANDDPRFDHELRALLGRAYDLKA